MKLLKSLIPCIFYIGSVYAEPFVISDVRVEGLQRITAGSFFNYLPVKVGDKVDDSEFPNIIRTLYQTEFFEDVVLLRDGNVLVVEIAERPIIGEVNVEGNKDLDKKTLLKGLKDAGLGRGDSFDTMRLSQVKRELLNLYYTRSKYDVIINASAQPLERNRVALNIDIKEGISARIEQINIVGNAAFSEQKILDELKSTTTKWHSLLSKSDQYSGEKLRADIEVIEAFYLDRGFLDFRINSSQVSLTDDKKGVYITINIKEGLPYRVSASQFTGSSLVDEKVLQESLLFFTGDYYSRQKVRNSKEQIQHEFANLGYAFAEVQVLPKIDKTQQDVLLNFVITPGKKTYVRRVSFQGNYKTNDEVLRRELRQMEASVYNYKKVARSTERLQRLPHITSVTRREVPVDGKPDQVDVVYEIIETPGRSITAGIGYGSGSGVILSASYNSSNFLGTGTIFNIDFSNSSTTKNYALSFTDPYWTTDGISRTYSFYYREEDEDEADIGDWTTDNWGALVRFGFPINEYESFRLGAGYRGIDVKTGDEVATEITDLLAAAGKTKFNEFFLDFSWTHDTRDKTIFTTKGSITRLSADVVVPGSDETYYKLGVRNRSYFALNNSIIMAARGDISYADGYGDTKDLPFYRHYYAGGLSTLRGFKSSSLGPRFANDDVAGGDFRVTGGLEAIFPWSLGVKNENVRVGAFLDFGNVFADYQSFDVGDFRYSTGLYLLWQSPVGPLNLSYGVPLNDKKGDDIENFQFTIGVPL